VLAGALGARAQCAEPPPSAPPSWQEQLDRALRCEGATTPLDRERCFGDVLFTLNQWPASPERERAFDRAKIALESWPAAQRAARATHVIHERDGRVLDTLQLVRALTDWYPEDTDRQSARLTKLAIESPFAQSMESLALVRAPVAWRWFTDSGSAFGWLHATSILRIFPRRFLVACSPSNRAPLEGPGLSRLRSLSLKDTGEPAHDFKSLLRWEGLATLEQLSLLDEGSFIQSDSLWGVLREARALRALNVHFYGAAAAVDRLAKEPSVSARLRSLSLHSGYLGARSVDALIANTALASLSLLDLRGNSLRDEDLRRLRAAPHFARTEILAGAPPR